MTDRGPRCVHCAQYHGADVLTCPWTGKPLPRMAAPSDPARAAAVEGMVVGIDCHGERVGGAGQRVRRLEHLPGIERMEVGVVVGHSFRHLAQHRSHVVDGGCRRGLCRQIAK